MKNIIRKLITITLAAICLTGCSEQTVSENSASNSENIVATDSALNSDEINDISDEDIAVNEITKRGITSIDLAFELSDNTPVYEYKSSNGVNEYILMDEEISAGTLIHAFRETSDGYYQIEYVSDGEEVKGYIKIDESTLVETDIAYTLSNVDVQFELIVDYSPYYGPGIYYEKSEDKIEKGTVVHIVAIADNGWFMTEEGYFISNNRNTKDENGNISVALSSVEENNTVLESEEQNATANNESSQPTASVDSNNTNTNNTTTSAVAAPSAASSSSGVTEVDARDKINTFALSVCPENTIWGWNNSYTANDGKQYWACDGFAYMLSDYIFGNAPYTSIPVDIKKIRIGDILTTTTNNGHRCVVIGVDMTTGYIFTADGNCDGKVTYKLHKEISEITGVVTRYSDTLWIRGQSDVIKIVYGDFYVANPFNYQFELCYYVYNSYGMIERNTVTYYYADGSLDGGYWTNIRGYESPDIGSTYYDSFDSGHDYQWGVDHIYEFYADTNTYIKMHPDD